MKNEVNPLLLTTDERSKGIRFASAGHYHFAYCKDHETFRIRLPNGSCFYTTPQQEGIKPLLDALVRDARVG